MPATSFPTVNSTRDDRQSTTPEPQLTTPLPAVHRIEPATWTTLRETVAAEAECQICYALPYHPVTTKCGHTFCRSCLLRTLDHSNYTCPLCRRNLDRFAAYVDHPANSMLEALFQLLLPDLYSERARQDDIDQHHDPSEYPIFQCTLIFPHLPCQLHIFEPRYRLMIRRCLLTSQRQFGICLPAPPGSGHDVMPCGTMLQIESLRMLDDGRFLVQTRGLYRYKLLGCRTRDDYLVGQVQRVDDEDVDEVEAEYQQLTVPAISPEPASVTAEAVAPVVEGGEAADVVTNCTHVSGTTPEPASAPSAHHQPSRTLPAIARHARRMRRASPYPSTGSTATSSTSQPPLPTSIVATTVRSAPTSSAATTPNIAHLVHTCQQFLQILHAQRAPWFIERMRTSLGPIPNTPTQFSFWMATVLPIELTESYKLLQVTSVRQRLHMICRWIEQMRAVWGLSGNCSVM
ncbi:hypothetical protein IWQ60_004107 [Tieghemiomyces parasiticus]|uniref:Uncharacterized protein n=1 Tax=Tieghemiomyces parasiticus TaxID=78921 RepID=A0A9W8DVT7_9FUNG|nr:hypothetical protein IWQ60_004107 [Tieghemiomyces parasiticus]